MVFSKKFLALIEPWSTRHGLSAFQIEYIKTRYLALVDAAESRRARYLFYNKFIMYSMLISSVVMSACLSLERLGFSDPVKALLFWVPWCLSFFVMFLTKVSDTGVNKHYIAIEYFLEKLKSEGFLYLSQSGPYIQDDKKNIICLADSFPIFSERIEIIRLKFVNIFGDIQEGGSSAPSADASEILSLAAKPDLDLDDEISV